MMETVIFIILISIVCMNLSYHTTGQNNCRDEKPRSIDWNNDDDVEWFIQQEIMNDRTRDSPV